jgi:hypothetical protein
MDYIAMKKNGVRVAPSEADLKRWWERPLGIVALGIVVTVVGGLIVWLVSRYYDHPIAIRPEVQSQLEKKSIAGIVVDRDTNQGIGQASIIVVGRTEQSVTEDSGNFRIDFRSDSPQRLRLHVTKSGFQPLDTSVEPPENNLVLRLSKQ